MSRMILKLIATSAAALALAGCGNPGASGNATSTSAPATAAARAASTVNAAILAAAEPFEKLTETAFTAKPAELDATITEVRTAAAGVRGALVGDAASQLRDRLAAIGAARTADNRADLALAAVAGYRVLVGGVSAGTKVPTAVSLLDYAGFRYDADRKAEPARWADMAEAASFGREQWASVSPQVTDTALRAKMDKALNDMAGAASSRNASVAAASAQGELALVDDLETFFNAR